MLTKELIEKRISNFLGYENLWKEIAIVQNKKWILVVTGRGY